MSATSQPTPRVDAVDSPETPDPVEAPSASAAPGPLDEIDALDLARSQETTAACHAMLLRLAGKVPDDLLTQARYWLAEGDVAELARSIAFTAGSQRLPMLDLDIAMLGDLLVANGNDTSILELSEVVGYDTMPPFAFSTDVESVLAGGATTGTDPVDKAAVTAAREAPGTVGLWRAWRTPADGSPWPPPKRVFMVEVEAGSDPVAVTAAMQRALVAGGEPHPAVEVFEFSDALPAYQRIGRACGLLLWASTPERRIQVAPVFDEVDAEAGPRFADDHPLLEDAAERDRVLAHLDSGEALLVTTALMDDVVDTQLAHTVPMNFRTDGTWIWTDAVAYYLREHNLAPAPPLLAHIREVGYTVPALDGVAIHRALAVLEAPTDEEPVWTFDRSGSGAP